MGTDLSPWDDGLLQSVWKAVGLTAMRTRGRGIVGAALGGGGGAPMTRPAVGRARTTRRPMGRAIAAGASETQRARRVGRRAREGGGGAARRASSDGVGQLRASMRSARRRRVARSSSAVVAVTVFADGNS